MPNLCSTGSRLNRTGLLFAATSRALFAILEPFSISSLACSGVYPMPTNSLTTKGLNTFIAPFLGMPSSSRCRSKLGTITDLIEMSCFLSRILVWKKLCLGDVLPDKIVSIPGGLADPSSATPVDCAPEVVPYSASDALYRSSLNLTKASSGRMPLDSLSLLLSMAMSL